jgi:quercetin dioxygenase-like cupin family protein
VRVGVAPGVVFPKHTHPGDEIVYVLEGALEYQVAGRTAETLEAGQVLFIPAGTVHSVRNVGRSNGVELATYIVVKGEPLLSIVE